MRNLTRIQMLIHQFRPIACGAELQAERLAGKLAERNCSVQVTTNWLDRNYPRFEVFNGFEIERVNFQLGYRIDGTCVQTLRHLYRKRDDFDILHSHMAFGHAVTAVILGQMCRKKTLFKIACAGPYGELAVLSTFRFGRTAIEILKQADAVAAISTEVANELIGYGFDPAKIHKIPNGVNVADFNRQAPYVFPARDEPFRFVLIGRRVPQKGIDTAIEAARLLKDRRVRRFTVELYGHDYIEHDYRKTAADAGVTDVVRFYSYTTEIKKLLNDIHCFILPSRGEGLSNALLEAMSMQLPCIASRVSGTIDIITDRTDGLLINHSSPTELADAMQELLESERRALALGAAARERVCSGFSIDVVADRYKMLYQTLMDSQGTANAAAVS